MFIIIKKKLSIWKSFTCWNLASKWPFWPSFALHPALFTFDTFSWVHTLLNSCSFSLIIVDLKSHLGCLYAGTFLFSLMSLLDCLNELSSCPLATLAAVCLSQAEPVLISSCLLLVVISLLLILFVVVLIVIGWMSFCKLICSFELAVAYCYLLFVATACDWSCSCSCCCC